MTQSVITRPTGSNVQSVYSANNLNQYTSITNPSQSPTYDDDGNMTQCSLGVSPETWSLTWNAENRLAKKGLSLLIRLTKDIFKEKF